MQQYPCAELDTSYARFSGLPRDELRYILDSKEVYGEDFHGENLLVLKEKEIMGSHQPQDMFQQL